jgi:hypothetical protein
MRVREYLVVLSEGVLQELLQCEVLSLPGLTDKGDINGLFLD